MGRKNLLRQKRILYLQFDVENAHSNKDVSITIDGIRNKLTAKNHLYYNGNTTFTYVMKTFRKAKKGKSHTGSRYVPDLQPEKLQQWCFDPGR